MVYYIAQTLHFCSQTRLNATLVWAGARVEFSQSNPDTLTRAKKKLGKKSSA